MKLLTDTVVRFNMSRTCTLHMCACPFHTCCYFTKLASVATFSIYQQSVGYYGLGAIFHFYFILKCHDCPAEKWYYNNLIESKRSEYIWHFSKYFAAVCIHFISLIFMIHIEQHTTF